MGTNFPLFSIYRNLDELLSNLYFDTARLIKKCIYNIQTLLREINNINASENEIYKTFIQCEGVEECLFRMENIYELVLEQCIELSQNEQQMQVYRTFRKALRKRAFGGGRSSGSAAPRWLSAARSNSSVYPRRSPERSAKQPCHRAADPWYRDDRRKPL